MVIKRFDKDFVRIFGHGDDRQADDDKSGRKEERTCSKEGAELSENDGREGGEDKEAPD